MMECRNVTLLGVVSSWWQQVLLPAARWQPVLVQDLHDDWAKLATGSIRLPRGNFKRLGGPQANNYGDI